VFASKLSIESPKAKINKTAFEVEIA